jgi:hypothetical protein
MMDLGKKKLGDFSKATQLKFEPKHPDSRVHVLIYLPPLGELILGLWKEECVSFLNSY